MPEPMPDKPQVITESAPIGSTVCPSCRGWKWIECRSPAFCFMFFVAFPFSILALAFARPFFQCANCGYELNHTVGTPRTVAETPSGTSRLVWLGVIWCVIGIGGALALKAYHDAVNI